MPELRQQTLQPCVLQLFSPEGAGNCCRMRMFSLEQLQLLVQTHFCHLSCIERLMDSLQCQMEAMWNTKHPHLGSKKGNAMVQKEDYSRKSQDTTGNWGIVKGSAAATSATVVLAYKVDGDTAGSKKNFQMHHRVEAAENYEKDTHHQDRKEVMEGNVKEVTVWSMPKAMEGCVNEVVVGWLLEETVLQVMVHCHTCDWTNLILVQV